mmetsp:Transcript_23870/g.34916  ORF Transcript_23870/g.34916 Transcript_23870/m.34916 type:complete len:360 (+) Transcript_23870:1-1080(+)|eukprot:CAMPEP_0195515198 /NCGR_PEP_ID=MMETSP0794_2-20130614/6359_1 /TAXON_ID=515487 /ORGANISM="Stephanopyxis turris, Strain CCMP 815" /LENGTH=359 /DNA_ID=CAMNT_0040643593 /DNA_START=1 /DNA_END=1080 /DNA_ORIENTATION=-
MNFCRGALLFSGLLTSATSFTPVHHRASLFPSPDNNAIRKSNKPKTLSAIAAAVNGETTSTHGSQYTAIKLSVCEKARTVATVCTSGTMCTLSSHEGIEGSPFGSFVDYVLDDDGNPVLLMNEMSMHTINIRENAKSDGESTGKNMVSLFMQTAGQGGQDVSRCSVTGVVEKIPEDAEDMDAMRMKYSITHAYAEQVMDSPKFAFYRLVPEKIYFVGGFGVLAEWVPVDDYMNAEADVLAREATEVRSKLNRDHKEDLELTAKHLLDVNEDIENIRVTSVDRLGMDVRVTKKISRRKLITDEFRIGFRIPVISVEDAKSEILKVFQEAWEKGQGYSWDSDDELPGTNIPIIKFAEDSLS